MRRLFFVAPAENKRMQAYLVLDYTNSMMQIGEDANPDVNENNLSDAVEVMEEYSELVIGALMQSADAQMGIYEFHREDPGFPPAEVIRLTTEEEDLLTALASIRSEYVRGFPASTRCWDAVYMAVSEFSVVCEIEDTDFNLWDVYSPGKPEEAEKACAAQDVRRMVIFLSDGRDESSTRSPDEIILESKRRDVAVWCIGFGRQLVETDLKRICSATGGRYYRAGSGGDPEELGQQFEILIEDLGGQYTLRWATLKRDDEPFLPRFVVQYKNEFASYTGTPYLPTLYVGNPLAGDLGQSSFSAVTEGESTFFLRSRYVPRHIKQIRIGVDSEYTLSGLPRIVPSDEGGIIPDYWSITFLGEQEGVEWYDLASNAPDAPDAAITFGAFGSILEFVFEGVPDDASSVGELYVDNSVYDSEVGVYFSGISTRVFTEPDEGEGSVE